MKTRRSSRNDDRRPPTPAALLLALVLSLGTACHGLGGAVSASASPPGGQVPTATRPLGPTHLSDPEVAIRDAVRSHRDADVALLERAVNISSGTSNTAGVRRVGELFAQELRALGFTTRWVEMPASMQRAGHLVAERAGTRGPRVLLIGHLDTVFEGEGQRFVREDTIARGAGVQDMKGGDVALVAALRALHATGALDGARVTVIMTGDEESVGTPLEIARRELNELAGRSDIALAFEGGARHSASIARRGASSWTLAVQAQQGHSSGIFSPRAGYGAAYELARILDTFRRDLAGDPTLTFNPGLVASGTEVTLDSSGFSVTATGKQNIIAPVALARGDLRFLRETQKDSVRARMREIVDTHLPGTTADIRFIDRYPAMSPSAAGERLLGRLHAVSLALGYGPVVPDPPESRGAGDVSFVAPYIAGMDGLGAVGRGAHSPRELVQLPSLQMAAERAAILLHRLIVGAQ